VGEEELAAALAADILAAVLSRRYTLNSRRLDRAARRRGIVLDRSAAAALLRKLAERGFVIDAEGRVWRLKLLRTSKEVRLAAEVVGNVERAQVSGG
jgi:hypothetical protein